MYFQQERYRVVVLEREENIEGREESEQAAEYKDLLALSVSLLCQYRPDEVIKYVKKKYYPTTVCLEICRKHGAALATAYLFKCTGAFPESMEAYLAVLKGIADKLLSPELAPEIRQHLLLEYSKRFSQSLKVCRRNADLTRQGEADQSLWFAGLDHLRETWVRLSVVAEKLAPATRDTISGALSECIRKLLGALSEYVQSEHTLVQIAERYGELELDNFKDMFGSMVVSHVLHEKILCSARVILTRQMVGQYSELVRISHTGRSVKGGGCARCGRYAGAFGTEFLAFPCGHIFHTICARDQGHCEVCLAARRDAGDLRPEGEENKEEAGKKPRARKERPQQPKDQAVISAANRRKEIYMKKMRAYEKSRVKSYPVRMRMKCGWVVYGGGAQGTEE